MAAGDCALCLPPGTGAPRTRPAAAHLLSASPTQPARRGALASPVPGGHPSGRQCVGTRPPGKKWGEELGRRVAGRVRERKDESSREQSPI